jgi:hypothetical protein
MATKNENKSVLDAISWLLVKPGTPEQRNTEHRNSIIPEHGTQEH